MNDCSAVVMGFIYLTHWVYLTDAGHDGMKPSARHGDIQQWPLQTDACSPHKGDQTLDNVVLLGDVITCRKLSELMPRHSEHERTRE